MSLDSPHHFSLSLMIVSLTLRCPVTLVNYTSNFGILLKSVASACHAAALYCTSVSSLMASSRTVAKTETNECKEGSGNEAVL